VLRRYRAGGDTAREAEVMRHVAAHGYPVPHVHEADGRDLVLERLTGPMALRALLDGEIGADAVGVLLAGLHRRLHALPPRTPSAAGSTVLHLDLHPDNVVLTAAGPVVIDWRNAVDGPADLDTAMTALILAQVVVAGAEPLASLAGTGLGAFVAAVDGRPAAGLPAALERRRADPALTTRELAELDAAAELVVADRGPMAVRRAPRPSRSHS
jgi:Ser/Thr protein kinase RdoA (MazF antagonist)